MVDLYRKIPLDGSVEIVPAILPHSFKDLQKSIESIKDASVSCIQIDAVDGQFVHNKTWPFRDESSFDLIVKEEHGLPLWEHFDFEFDLMMQHPHDRVMDFVHAGSSRIIIHAKSEGAIAAVQTLVDLREETGALQVQVGVAVGCDMQPDDLEPFEAQFDYVQVMGINRVGYQGEPFDIRALHLVERIRARYHELPIQVDGGVSLDNVRALANAGATRLVVGSAIFKTDDPVAAIAALKAEANRVI